MISRIIKIAFAAIIAATSLSATSVKAEDGVTGNIAIVSNYIWRGVTQTNDQPAIQGGLDYTKGNLSLGTWGSGLDIGGTEIDLYGNYSFGKISAGFIYYYIAKSTGSSGSYEANISGDVGPVSLMASYAPSTSTYYVEAAYSFEISKKMNLDTHIGYEGTDPDASIGVTYATKNYDVNATLATKNSVSAASFGISKSL